MTALQRDIFSGMSRIRALRLSDNPFACDCHLSWLSRFLRSAPRLAPYTRCHSPSQLKGQNVADLHDQEFKCSGEFNFINSFCYYFQCYCYVVMVAKHSWGQTVIVCTEKQEIRVKRTNILQIFNLRNKCIVYATHESLLQVH